MSEVNPSNDSPSQTPSTDSNVDSMDSEKNNDGILAERSLENEMKTALEGQQRCADLTAMENQGIDLDHIHPKSPTYGKQTEEEGKWEHHFPCGGKNIKMADFMPQECYFCQETFLSMTDLSHHLATHTKEKRYKCLTCGKGFLSRKNATIHLLVHLEVIEGGVEFLNRKLLERRYSSYLKEEEPVRFHCNQCEITYSDYEQLAGHIAWNHGQRTRNIKIPLPPKVQEEIPEGTWRCKECGKVYATERYLKQHINRCHSGKEFKCPQCGTPLATKKGVKRHINTVHLGLKEAKVKVECPQCGKSLCSKKYLNHHINTVHLGLKKEAEVDCPHCGKRYATKRILQKHVESVHQGIRYRCSKCRLTFARKSGLWKHEKAAH